VPLKLLLVILLVVLFASFTFRKFAVKKVEGPIVFLGNSITAGAGAGPGEDFPSIVARELNVEVVNAGVSGDSVFDALQRLEIDVLAEDPKIVVVELGGNDFLQGTSLDSTFANFEIIMQKLKLSGVKIVIVSVNIPLKPSYEARQKEMAKKYDGVFVPNILRGVISDPRFMSDSVHPNAMGYQIIAKRVIKGIKKV